MRNLIANRIHKLFAGTACGLSLLLPCISNATAEQEWRFRVYLDDREIGYHQFTLAQDGELQRLSSRARFDVTFLKIPFYRYRHESLEHWNSKCLQEITSNTDQNGRHFHVAGMARDGAFEIRSNTGDHTLPSCISTFAYWDKSFLERGRLLNSQTGEYLDVEVNYLGESTLALGESAVQAHQYRITANDLDIEVWYSSDDEWLALDSTTTNGSRLRYVAE